MYPFVVVRSEIIFLWEPNFRKIVSSLNPTVKAQIINDLQGFERIWRASDIYTQLPQRFDFKQLTKARGSYAVCQIRIAQQNYRAVVMFPDEQVKAWWIHMFKKGKNNERQEVQYAIERAEYHCNTIKGA